MSDTIRKTVSEQTIPCICGKGKIIHRKVEVFNSSSTWGTYDDEYIVNCTDCKENGYIITFDRESHERFLMKKVMKIDI